MKLKSVFTIVMAATLLTGSLSAQNKTSKESKMGKSLVVYFSLAGEQYNVGNIKEGNTSIIAKFIAEETGSELFELETLKPYPTDSYSRLTQIAKDEQNKKARPASKLISTSPHTTQSSSVIQTGGETCQCQFTHS